ncbi:MAG TPA: TIGR01440 family protein [Clostridiaceae bacterium]|nr:TIGR01440 family protein [Clostridiaceae bacterium]
MDSGDKQLSEDQSFLREIENETRSAITQLVNDAHLTPGIIVVVGCSSSEVSGHRIGSSPSTEIANVIYDTIAEVLAQNKIHLAAQCCEHLNRCIIIERAVVPDAEIVNVIPWQKGGGSFAARAYETMKHPVAVEKIKADAGLDIGDTFIGMHLKDVVVSVRLQVKNIGFAHVTAARTRPKTIGGDRAIYDEDLARGYKRD